MAGGVGPVVQDAAQVVEAGGVELGGLGGEEVVGRRFEGGVGAAFAEGSDGGGEVLEDEAAARSEIGVGGEAGEKGLAVAAAEVDQED